MSKWIYFMEYDPFRIDGRINRKKTTMYWVMSKSDKARLGEIKWYGPWRKYAFFPEVETVFETTCLRDIVEFIIELMDKRKFERTLRLKKLSKEAADSTVSELNNLVL